MTAFDVYIYYWTIIALTYFLKMPNRVLPTEEFKTEYINENILLHWC